jgi:ABC-type phosphate transport system substrate-binding protein
MGATTMRTRLLTLVAAVLVFAAPTRAVAAQGFDLVVHPSYAGATVPRDVAVRVFLKQVGTFNGKPAAPVDQAKDSPVRVAFTKAVHGRTVAAIEGYWQQQIFSGGSLPPANKSSDADVLAFVKGNPGAIGYVSAGAGAGGGVKVVTVGN